MTTRLPLLRELTAARLIHPSSDPEPVFLFNHVLVQETAYNSLLVKDRRELHLLVAAAYEQVYADQLDEHVPTLAYHYWRGEDWRRAALFARRAGERAFKIYALREAIAYYTQARQALDRLPDPPGEEICDVILGWTDAAFGFEPFPKLLEQLARAEQWARQLGDKRRLAMALLSIGEAHVAAGHPPLAEGPLTECFALATELGDDQLAVLPTFNMGMVTVDSEPLRALDYFDRAAKLANQYRNIDVEAFALGMRAIVEARLGDGANCLQDVGQALQRTSQGTSPTANAEVYLCAAWSYFDLGDAQQALTYAQRAVDQAVAADDMPCACLSFAILGFGHLRAEQTIEAIRAFEEAIRRSTISGAEEAQVLGESGLGMARFFSGHPDAIRELEKALEHARRSGKEYAGALLSLTLGEIHLKRGEVEPATTYLKDALEYYRRHGMRLYLARTLELYADALERQGQAEKAHAARGESAGLVTHELAARS